MSGKKIIKYTAVFLLLVSSGLAEAQVSKDSLAGVWQDSRIVASGWSNTFLFFKDGKFKFFYNQMDCLKRNVSYSGIWKIKGEELVLTIKEKTIIYGGKTVPSTGSCASDSMIVDGIKYDIPIITLQKNIYSVSPVYIDTEDDIQRFKVYIDAMPYWKFSDDPAELLNQFEK